MFMTKDIVLLEKLLRDLYLLLLRQVFATSIKPKNFISRSTLKTAHIHPYKHTTWIPRFHVVSTWNPRGVFVGIMLHCLSFKRQAKRLFYQLDF